jgi:uncharacterized protein (DUF433 family)
MTEQEVLEDYDYLTQKDIRACFAYVALTRFLLSESLDLRLLGLFPRSILGD